MGLLQIIVRKMADAPAMGTITEVLADVRAGKEHAIDDLIEIAYPELRRLARHYMQLERPDHTLQATGPGA